MRRFRRTGQRENDVPILFQASDQRPVDSAGSTGNQDSHAIPARKGGCEAIDMTRTLLPHKEHADRRKELREVQ
jgi:hypothetical protein